jgi:hypothetical protein
MGYPVKRLGSWLRLRLYLAVAGLAWLMAVEYPGSITWVGLVVIAGFAILGGGICDVMAED